MWLDGDVKAKHIHCLNPLMKFSERVCACIYVCESVCVCVCVCKRSSSSSLGYAHFTVVIRASPCRRDLREAAQREGVMVAET